LQSINLNGNQLKSIDELADVPRLRRISAADNLITDLPLIFANLKLDARYNFIFPPIPLVYTLYNSGFIC